MSATDGVKVIEPGQIYVGKQGFAYGAGAAQTSLGNLRDAELRALAMRKNKHGEMSQKKHDNLPV